MFFNSALESAAVIISGSLIMYKKIMINLSLRC